MCSVLMPYWDRPAELSETLDNFAEHYPRWPFQVVVCDDGSPRSAAEVLSSKPGLPYDVKLVELPRKAVPKSPCVPFNVAAKNADSDVLVLTNPEQPHRGPILPGMLEFLADAGPRGYIVAACYRQNSLPNKPEGWLQNSSTHMNSILNWCSMLYAEFYWEIGGFYEGFRDGTGGEDNDFRDKVVHAGANIVCCDDLVTDHISRGCDEHTVCRGTAEWAKNHRLLRARKAERGTPVGRPPFKYTTR